MSSSHGASSSGCRFCFALMPASIDAVGCQNARSGLSPVAILVWMLCSYGSVIVTTSTLAPVVSSNASTTASGTVLEFCAAQMVSSTPDRSASCAGHSAGAPPEVEPPAPGSEQAVSARPAVSRIAVRAGVFFIGSP